MTITGRETGHDAYWASPRRKAYAAARAPLERNDATDTDAWWSCDLFAAGALPGLWDLECIATGTEGAVKVLARAWVEAGEPVAAGDSAREAAG
jgi:hypothetical protein